VIVVDVMTMLSNKNAKLEEFHLQTTTRKITLYKIVALSKFLMSSRFERILWAWCEDDSHRLCENHIPNDYVGVSTNSLKLQTTYF